MRGWSAGDFRRIALSFDGAEEGSPRTSSKVLAFVVLAFWLALVVFTTSRHEFWRDEVRALTLARTATSPFDLYELIRYDGHPVLWYLLLFLGTSIVDTPLVLPITSVLIAFAAVALFMWFAPFPWWFRCVFIFSALPAFEYSVMARNYGISMLLFFLAALLYRTRTTHPFRLAFILALLANTNVHSAILTCLVSAVWAWDIVVDQKRGVVPVEYSRYLPFAVVGAGVLLCLLFTMPRENTILTPVRGSESIGQIGAALRGAVLRPDLTFSELIPLWLRPKLAVLMLYGAILGLVSRPSLLLAALGAQITFGAFFRVVYPGWYRHQGLYLVFLVFLYWVYIESAPARTRSSLKGLMFQGGLYGAVLVVVLTQLSRTPQLVRADIIGARSASKAFGEFLNHSTQFQNAVIVPEPDYNVESLPYYADNQVYLPRESRFGKTVSWTSASKAHLTLGELLQAARDVRSRTGSPVLIVLEPLNLDGGAGEQKYMYGKVFSWTAAEAEEFRNATTLLREFDASEGDEDYRVFLLAGSDQATGGRAGRVMSSASAHQITLLHVPFYSAPPPGFSLSSSRR